MHYDLVEEDISNKNSSNNTDKICYQSTAQSMSCASDANSSVVNSKGIKGCFGTTLKYTAQPANE